MNEKECPTCKKVFLKPKLLSPNNWSKVIYCSRSCYHDNGRSEISCAICSKKVTVRKSDKDKTKTCSKECAKINFSNNAKARGLGKESHFKAGSKTAREMSERMKADYKAGRMEHMIDVWEESGRRWTGKGNPGYKDGLYHGYPMIKVNGRWMETHRHLMEEKLGRKLMYNEVVHHINGIKADYRIENLIVMTRATHLAHHKAERRSQGKKQ